MAEPVIELDHVWKVFGPDPGAALADARAGLSKREILEKHHAVLGIADVSLSVPRSEIFCIMGLSGSGKSTLIRHVNRLIEPTAGAIRVLGQDVTALGDAALRDLQARRMGMVFQHIGLLPHRTVRDNVGYPLEIRGEPRALRWRVSQEKLRLVGLTGYEDRYPNELSGGMQQRVGLARALASDPDILLMDEPFSALDPLIRRQLQDEFLDLSVRLGKTTLFITHDLDEAIRLGTRIAIMKDGRIIQVGTAADIVMAPADDYVRDFAQHISKLKILHAQSIMLPVEAVSAAPGYDVDLAPRATAGCDLAGLIDLLAGSAQPAIVVDPSGLPIGAVTKDRLLTAIKEGR
jgi:glycine betaine/proline transport system ATP-binding protein